MKKILIAGGTSGAGKTTITLGILAALSKKYRIQPYKVGPDYVDTKFHSRITGIQSRNLDNFLVPDKKILAYLFTKNNKKIDLALVEGVMGLYDGLGTDKDAYSTASIAKQLDLPVVLVINAKATSTSAAAMIKGYLDFDPQVRIKGVILNNIMSQNHYELVKGAIERYSSIKVLGYLPFDQSLALPSRQLGLIPDNELDDIDQKINHLASLVQKYIDLNLFLKLAEPVSKVTPLTMSLPTTHFKLGIAQDLAFNFYYADNLELLRKVGIELITFSPMKDQHLPKVDALYFGGGYPEEFAQELSRNESLKQQILAFSQQNRPIYAECGGLMYLGRFLRTTQRDYPMVGIFPGYSEMTPRLKRFGYCYAQAQQDTLIALKGQSVVGHEFHHSVFHYQNQELRPVLKMTKVRDGHITNSWWGGYQIQKTFASYLHVHFFQSQRFIQHFLNSLGDHG